MTDAVINNGKLVNVSLPDFVGVAGFVRLRNGDGQLSYRPQSWRKQSEIGTAMTIDGSAWTVASVSRAAVDGFRLVGLKPVAAEEGAE